MEDDLTVPEDIETPNLEYTDYTIIEEPDLRFFYIVIGFIVGYLIRYMVTEL